MKKKLLSILVAGLCVLAGCGGGTGDGGADFINNNKSYYIMIDGEKFYAGDEIANFSEVGYELEEDAKDLGLESDTYMIGTIYMENEAGESIFDITPFNDGKSTVKVSEAFIGGIRLNEYDAKDDERAAAFEVYGGIKLGSTMDEVKDVFGEPGMTSEGETYTVYRYESDETYRGYIFTFNEEGKVKTIEWTNLVY